MFHWCPAESEALLVSIPFVGYYLRKGFKWYHNAFHGKKHNHEVCVASHVKPCSWPQELAHIPHGKVGEGPCVEHNLSEVLLPIPPERIVISPQDAECNFGILPLLLLKCDRKLLEVDYFPDSSEFVYMIDSLSGSRLTARWKNKFFTWDGKKLWQQEWLEQNEQDTGDSHSGLDQEQKTDSGSSQSDQETSQEVGEAKTTF
jgi:hypothetical protein